MNIVEMYDLCKKVYADNIDTYDFIGLRFEDKERKIGEICENSKHNSDREDEREFPQFGTEEYEDMEELEGTSSWDLSARDTMTVGRFENKEDDCKRHFNTYHCYIVGGNDTGSKDMDLDQNEIVIKNAVVIAQIF